MNEPVTSTEPGTVEKPEVFTPRAVRPNDANDDEKIEKEERETGLANDHLANTSNLRWSRSSWLCSE
jgi:hypothetical protein